MRCLRMVKNGVGFTLIIPGLGRWRLTSDVYRVRGQLVLPETLQQKTVLQLLVQRLAYRHTLYLL